MAERQVTVGQKTYPLPKLFMVLATQNPLEQEGTYPLPEAQLDRFMFKLLIDFPSLDELDQIVNLTSKDKQEGAKKVIDGDQILMLKETASQVPIAKPVQE